MLLFAGLSAFPEAAAADRPCATTTVAPGAGAGTGAEDFSVSAPTIVILPATLFVPGSPARPEIAIPGVSVPPASVPGTPAVSHPGTPALGTPAVAAPTVHVQVGDIAVETPQLRVPAQSLAPAQPPQTLVPAGSPTTVAPGVTTPPIVLLPGAPGLPAQAVTVGEGTPVAVPGPTVAVLGSPTACVETPAGDREVGAGSMLDLLP